ncbi:hypothetical protein LINPERHAP1_LOCUS15101 [Linum perenne]
MNVAGTPNNRGRIFYRCPYWRDRRADCGFFRWVDQMPVGEASKMEDGISSNMQNCQLNQESINVAQYLQRKEDDRAVAGERMLEEISAIRQSVAVLESRIGYVIVSLCVLVVFIGLGLNKK